jgi:hypothetical protein
MLALYGGTAIVKKDDTKGIADHVSFFTANPRNVHTYTKFFDTMKGLWLLEKVASSVI